MGYSLGGVHFAQEPVVKPYEELEEAEMEAFEKTPYRKDILEREPIKLPGEEVPVREQIRVLEEAGMLQELNEVTGAALQRLMENKAALKETSDRVKEATKEALEMWIKQKGEDPWAKEKALTEKQKETWLEVIDGLDNVEKTGNRTYAQFESGLVRLRHSVEIIVTKEVPPETYQKMVSYLLDKVKGLGEDIYKSTRAYVKQIEREGTEIEHAVNVAKEIKVWPKASKGQWVAMGDLKDWFYGLLDTLRGIWNWIKSAFQKFVSLGEEATEFAEDVMEFEKLVTAAGVKAMRKARIEDAIGLVAQEMKNDPYLNAREAAISARKRYGYPELRNREQMDVLKAFEEEEITESWKDRKSAMMRPIDDIEKYTRIREASSLIDELAQEISSIGRIEDRKVKRFKIEEIDSEGKVVCGAIDFALQINLPRYARKVQIGLPLKIENGKVSYSGVFEDSGGDKHPFTERGLKRLLRLEETPRRVPRRMSTVKRSQEYDISPAMF